MSDSFRETVRVWLRPGRLIRVFGVAVAAIVMIAGTINSAGRTLDALDEQGRTVASKNLQVFTVPQTVQRTAVGIRVANSEAPDGAFLRIGTEENGVFTAWTDRIALGDAGPDGPAGMGFLSGNDTTRLVYAVGSEGAATHAALLTDAGVRRHDVRSVHGVDLVVAGAEAFSSALGKRKTVSTDFREFHISAALEFENMNAKLLTARR